MINNVDRLSRIESEGTGTDARHKLANFRSSNSFRPCIDTYLNISATSAVHDPDLRFWFMPHAILIQLGALI